MELHTGVGSSVDKRVNLPTDETEGKLEVMWIISNTHYVTSLYFFSFFFVTSL